MLYMDTSSKFIPLNNSESSLTDNQMTYLLLANILLLIHLNIECSWLWIDVPTTPMQAWITLRLPVPFPKLKTGESFVQVAMPPTVHTGIIGWLTSGNQVAVISHAGDRPMEGLFPIPVRLWILFLIVNYPILLMHHYLVRVFLLLVLLLALVVATVIVWSMWNSWI